MMLRSALSLLMLSALPLAAMAPPPDPTCTGADGMEWSYSVGAGAPRVYRPGEPVYYIAFCNAGRAILVEPGSEADYTTAGEVWDDAMRSSSVIGLNGLIARYRAAGIKASNVPLDNMRCVCEAAGR